MHAIKRADYIMETLKQEKVVMVAELSRELGVTEETIRKDLEKLETQQLLCRVHGGAYLIEGFGTETPVRVRSKLMQQEKQFLAKQCIALIKEKESIFLDCSTTMVYLAKELAAARKKMTVMTNSLEAAAEIVKNPALRLILLGGEYNQDTGGFEGQAVQALLKVCHIDKAFISSAGLSLTAGITDSTRTAAEIRRQVIEQAHTCIFAADSTKLGKHSVYVIGRLSDLNYLVTDQPLEQINKKMKTELDKLQTVILDSAGDAEQKRGKRKENKEA